MSYRHYRYLLMTLDPTHVGAGGYRLGRVDNSIIREPGTDLPKIPGTSLSGAIRSYAAYRYGKIRCAGQGQPHENEPDSGHCGESDCPICYTFGYTVGDKSNAGTVSIFDAHVLLFPVHSMIGPVWVSTKRRLTDFGFDVDGVAPTDEPPGQESFVTTQVRTEPLNLGWLMLPVTGTATVTPPAESDWGGAKEWTSIQKRIVLVPETLFSQIVKANLEVRTSVSIDPRTGAAQSGALFTYEAIPRATFLAFDLVQDDYRSGPKPWSAAPVAHTTTGQPLYPDPNNPVSPIVENGQFKGWREPYQVVQSGLEWAAMLGVGGMGTRGFGRIKLVGSGWEVQNG